MEPSDPPGDLEARVDARLEELAAVSPAAHEAGEDLLAAGVELHTAALTELLRTLREVGGDAAVDRVASDPVVDGILVLHDLHPTDVATRVDTALHDVLRELGGGAPVGGALLAVEGGVARVSLAAATDGDGCHGPSRSEQVVHALLTAVPELERVEVVPPLLQAPAEPTEVRLPLPKLRPAPTARTAPTAPPPVVPSDGCELCASPIAGDHGHGVDVEQHRLVCLCDPCRIVLGANREGHGRFRALPDRVVADPSFAAADGEWEALGIPVSTAFFFRDSVADGIVAFYPSPAGATESLLGPHEWEALASTSELAADLAPDTEAMLVRRDRDTHESYLVPVDRCYELVGLLRTHWRGFDGGEDAHDALDAFFARIRNDARVEISGVVARA